MTIEVERFVKELTERKERYLRGYFFPEPGIDHFYDEGVYRAFRIMKNEPWEGQSLKPLKPWPWTNQEHISHVYGMSDAQEVINDGHEMIEPCQIPVEVLTSAEAAYFQHIERQTRAN